MDQHKSFKTKISSLIQSIKVHNYLLNLTKVLVLVSLFFIIFSQISLLSFLNQFNFYFVTFSLQLFTHTIDKNCMFLLCNGLLAFVGITRSLSGSSGVDEVSKYGEDGSQSQYSDAEANESMLVEEKPIEAHDQNNEAHEAIEIKYSVKEVEDENTEYLILEDEEEGEGSGRISGFDEEDEPDDEIGPFDTEGEEEEEKESEIIDEFHVAGNVEEEKVVKEENLVLSTEELNKKFDEFIRRMKEDLRIEARRRLVMV